MALNISKVSDKLWHSSILFKLPSFGFPSSLCLFGSSFLSVYYLLLLKGRLLIPSPLEMMLIRALYYLLLYSSFPLIIFLYAHAVVSVRVSIIRSSIFQLILNQLLLLLLGFALVLICSILLYLLWIEFPGAIVQIQFILSTVAPRWRMVNHISSTLSPNILDSLYLEKFPFSNWAIPARYDYLMLSSSLYFKQKNSFKPQIKMVYRSASRLRLEDLFSTSQ